MNNKQCIICNKNFQSPWQQTKCCSYECRQEHKKRNNKLNKIPRLSLTPNKTGAVSELEVCAYYIREGYEVFRNVAMNGVADIIIWKPETGELHRIDVKSFLADRDPTVYIQRLEEKNNNLVEVVPYNYNTKKVLRTLWDPLRLTYKVC